MSPSEIVNILKKRNPETFERLSQTTVNEWIDTTGDCLRWKDTTLAKIIQGNKPGHSKGGRQGILVSEHFIYIT
jgi:hypothetical protein